jgi:hypothetical protein
MLRIEIFLKNSDLMLAVQRKSEIDANLLFEQILAALPAEKVQLLQLTCDRHPKTKIAVLNRDIAAVSIAET